MLDDVQVLRAAHKLTFCYVLLISVFLSIKIFCLFV